MINIFGVIGSDVKASEVMKEIQAYDGDTIEVITPRGDKGYEVLSIEYKILD